MKKAVLIFAILVATGVFWFGTSVYQGELEQQKKVTSFSQCVEQEGSVIMEKFPEVCRTVSGEEFENLEQRNEIEFDLSSEEYKKIMEDKEKIRNEIRNRIVETELADSDNDKVSVSELSKHKNENDCWIVYKNKVYDVTAFLPIHPGGVDKILQFCGNSSTDFENAFHGQHGTSKVDNLQNRAGKLQGNL